jgi:hypothetical protein
VTKPIQALLERGVIVRAPGSVDIDESVDPARVAPGVVIHAGCRLSGRSTSIGPDCVLGEEAPATVEDCQLGAGVALKGGYFAGATFLDGANVGSAAHIRPGTLLEEEASCAHAVGLKQTIFFPFVTAGSLINFCDAFMAGGTSRKDHSEIGSSYIHFNYTPHQDKATASMIGDVPRGVMLDQRPVFLGGQGGLVGPVRIGYGNVIPAGVIHRRDAPEGGQLLYPQPELPKKPRAYRPDTYGEIARVVDNNLLYIANLRALQLWYRVVRSRFMKGAYHQACHDGALRRLDEALGERLKRLKEFAEKVGRSIEVLRGEKGEGFARALAQQERFFAAWPSLEPVLGRSALDHVGVAEMERFLAALDAIRGDASYIQAIKKVDGDGRQAGTAWLQAVVDSQLAAWQALLKG